MVHFQVILYCERADAMIMHEIAEVASMNGMVLSGEG